MTFRDNIPSADKEWTKRAEQKEFDDNTNPTLSESEINQLLQLKKQLIDSDVITESGNIFIPDIIQALKLKQRIEDKISKLSENRGTFPYRGKDYDEDIIEELQHLLGEK